MIQTKKDDDTKYQDRVVITINNNYKVDFKYFVKRFDFEIFDIIFI